MKIIDIVEKIINDEIIPKTIIKTSNPLISGDCRYYSYEIEKGEKKLIRYDFTAKKLDIGNLYLDCKTLDWEAEFVEEEKEIEEIELLKNYQEYLEKNFSVPMSNLISDIEAIFNELRDEINKLKKEGRKNA